MKERLGWLIRQKSIKHGGGATGHGEGSRPSGETLGDAPQIGLLSQPIAGPKSAGSEEASHYFIRNGESFVFPAKGNLQAKGLRRKETHAARPLHQRFKNEGGNRARFQST